MAPSMMQSATALVAGLGACFAAAAAPLPSFFGEAAIPSSWPPHFPCAASDDGMVGLRITHGLNAGAKPELHSVDLASGGSLGVLDSLDLDLYTNEVLGMRVSGDRAYLVPGLTVVDISDPGNLTVLGSEPGFGDIGASVGFSSLAVQGTTVYVLRGGFSVAIYDCADPANIIHVGTVQITGLGGVLSIDTIGDDKIIIGRSWQGATIHDTSVLGSLPVIGTVGGFQSSTLDVNDDLDVAYVLREDTSQIVLTSVDISDPTAPMMLDQYDLDDVSLFENTGPIAAIGDDILAIYVHFGRIELFDVSDPSDLVRMDPILENAENLARVDAESLLLATSNGVAVYSFAPCAADLTGDGLLNFFDISAFVNAFLAMDPVADFTGEGDFNFFDFSAYLAAFSAGCP